MGGHGGHMLSRVHESFRLRHLMHFSLIQSIIVLFENIPDELLSLGVIEHSEFVL